MPAVSAPPTAAQHADGTHRASRTLLPTGGAKAPASTIMCAKVAAKAGFSFTKTVSTSAGAQPQIVVAVAVAMAESSCTPRAKNVNNDGGSVDRGLWQMNSRYHPEVSDSCAYQIQCNANAAWKVSNHGASWSPWSAYNNGSWKSFLGNARAAISGGFTFMLGNQAAGDCLAADRADHSDGAHVWQWNCDPADNYQQWTVVSTVGAAPMLRNLAAGTCLTWDDAKTGNGAALIQKACATGNAAQQVAFVGTGRLNVAGEADALMQNPRAGTCVVADKTAIGNAKPVKQWACSSNDRYQMWN
ncbi:ricin-type beta-trefoil lectin domain protein [Catenulispora yoronensis]|uniref:ricin-type beta-trefoil lectin domain protein n=1 Tax=Catenulispora yoronensis TaxID=450799 RepID=UPI0031DBB25A